MNLHPYNSFLIAGLLFPHLLFSQKQNHFPDTIIDAYNSITKTADQFFGGTPTHYGRLVSPKALIPPSDTFVSLPTGSYVIFGFTDNYIIDAPNHADIYIEEVGGAGEFADVYVSSDNMEYTFLGKSGNGKVNVLDLATIPYEKPVYYIKVIGNDAKGESPGFDIRRIYGLPGSNQSIPPKPIVLENVLFETNKSNLLPESIPALDTLVQVLRANTQLKLEIRGHTDNVGSDTKNHALSVSRANSVLDYIVSKGIDRHRLTASGFGSTQPVGPNTTEDGRKRNRRVEFVQTE
jgi:outer membrane protein OmpA-like peptidoglycan-associated protein